MKRLLFLTATRAEFGKLKPLLRAVANCDDLEHLIVATGMHLIDRYGRTEIEITRAGFTNLRTFGNDADDAPMDAILARTVDGLGAIVREWKPDMIVVHGDRVEALAGAIVGALNNVLVGHVEGGEFSGTVDELMRHAVSKLSHVHFVANEPARDVLLQLGEQPDTIFVVGSPEVDVMLGADLPSLDDVRTYYDIPFESYALLAFHPVTTEVDDMDRQARELVAAARASGDNFVAVYPNNDAGGRDILGHIDALRSEPRFRIIPSIRFEYFQTLLKHAKYILGNSSSGVREAGVFGTPAVNVGSRQRGRNSSPLIVDVEPTTADITRGIERVTTLSRAPMTMFGDGRSAERFLSVVRDDATWKISHQKIFRRV